MHGIISPAPLLRATDGRSRSPDRYRHEEILHLYLPAIRVHEWRGSTLTSVGTGAVASADDFATTAFQDPWDMNERTDLGWFLNGVDQPGSAFTAVSFANGIFSGASGGSANVFLLETGNPNAASIGKIGRNFPIDASTHRLIAFRASTSATSTTFFHWNRDTIYDNTTTRSNTITTTPGFRFYLADLPTLGTTPIGTPAPFAWGGTVKSLWMFFNSAGSVSLDWVRLVDVQPSLCRKISWTGGGGTVNIYLDDNALSGDGNLGPIALNVTSATGEPRRGARPRERTATPSMRVRSRPGPTVSSSRRPA